MTYQILFSISIEDIYEIQKVSSIHLFDEYSRTEIYVKIWWLQLHKSRTPQILLNPEGPTTRAAPDPLSWIISGKNPGVTITTKYNMEKVFNWPAKNNWCATLERWSGTLRDEHSRDTMPCTEIYQFRWNFKGVFTNQRKFSFFFVEKWKTGKRKTKNVFTWIFLKFENKKNMEKWKIGELK